MQLINPLKREIMLFAICVAIWLIGDVFGVMTGRKKD